MTTSPTLSNSSAATTFIASLSMTSWPRTQLVEVDAGADGHPQLAAAGEDVDGPVVVAREEDAEAGRRLGQPVDLLLQGHDLVAGLLERRDQPLVLGGDRGEVRLQVGHPLLERAQVAGRLGEPLAQGVDLVPQRADLRIQVAASSATNGVGRRLLDGPWTTRRHLPWGHSRTREPYLCDPTFGRSACGPALLHGVSLRRRSTAAARGSGLGDRPRSGTAPLAGRRRRSGGATPSASRRVVSRKPVCPTIRWSGRTASPSRCQPRTSDSQALRLGEACRARASPRRCGTAGWRWRRSRRATPPGTSARGHRVQAVPGREHVEHDPVDARSRSRLSAEVADGRAARPGAGRRRTPRRSSGRCRRSPGGARTTTPARRRRPRAAASMVSAPEPTPASTTRAPGKMSAMCTICAGVLRVDHRGAARHRQHVVGEQRPQRQVR